MNQCICGGGNSHSQFCHGQQPLNTNGSFADVPMEEIFKQLREIAWRPSRPSKPSTSANVNEPASPATVIQQLPLTGAIRISPNQGESPKKSKRGETVGGKKVGIDQRVPTVSHGDPGGSYRVAYVAVSERSKSHILPNLYRTCLCFKAAS